MKAKIGERELDLAPAVPLTIGDFRKLKRDHGVDTKELLMNDVETQFKLIFYVILKALKKSGEAVSTVEAQKAVENQVEDLTMNEVTQILIFIAEGGKQVDAPFSKPSTPSPSTTDGTEAT